MSGQECPHCGKRVKKGRKQRRRAEAAVWQAVAAAVAVITAERGPGNYQVADLIGGQHTEKVIRATGIVAGAMLDVLAPEAATDRALRHLGLRALEKGAR